ncbi:MAG: glycosyltransferase family 4 protein [Pyrinomonadaceae bacterium]
MTRIALLTTNLATADAVGNDLLGMRGVLERHGHDVRIYASNWAFDEARVWPAVEITDYLTRPDDLLIYHYSMGWEFGMELLRDLPCRTSVKYHNVTPPEFFVGYSQEHEDSCRMGRRLQSLADAGCDLYMTASEYSMWELLLAGADKSRSVVVPPFHHIDRLHAVEPDISVLDALRDGKTNLLMVGRVFPNKGHAALIEAFAVYHRFYNRESRLLLVGKEEEGLAAYSQFLRELVAERGLGKEVVFTGGVSDEALKAYYMAADAFVFASEHEGFCVPLVEAMSMKLPVVTYASSAIPGTVGRAGLVWKERNPYLLAESIDVLVKNPDVRAGLGTAGWRRYERFFTNEKIEAQFLEAVGQLL